MAYVANNDSHDLLLTSSTDGIHWTGDSQIASRGQVFWSKAAPALLGFDGALFLAYVANDDSNQLLFTSSVDGGLTWSPNVPVGSQSSRTAPALAMLGGTLVLAYVAANDSYDLLVTISTSFGAGWLPDVRVGTQPQSSGAAPALAVLGDKVVMAYVAHDHSSDLLVTFSADGQNWAPDARTGQASGSQPGLAGFGGHLILAFSANNDARTLLTCMSSDGAAWSGNSIV